MAEDEPTPQEVAEAAAEVAAVVAAFAGGRPTIYPSAQRGPEPISAMNKTHAARAARLVRRGERPGGPPMAKALEKQAKTTRHLTK